MQNLEWWKHILQRSSGRMSRSDRESSRELNWKRPTTYNVLRKLCEKGIFQNVKGVVSSVLSREEYYAMQGEEFVEEAFRGSLPAFIAAFTSRKQLSDKEIAEIMNIINGEKG